MIAALVPAKQLSAGKSRLGSALPKEAIEKLSIAMLEDVLAALRAAPGIDTIVVVTPDRVVAEAARKAGVQALLRTDPGLNASLDAAARELADGGATALLVVLGDVPGLRASEVQALLGALDDLGGRGVVLAPSRDGGSPALLRAPHDAIASEFGAQSAASHRLGADQAGVPFRELELPGLAVDLDRPEDLDAFLAGPGEGQRTRKLLAELGWKPGAVHEAPRSLRLSPLLDLPLAEPTTALGPLLAGALRTLHADASAGVLVVCQKLVSKAEGRLVTLASVEPSARAREIAAEDGKDPQHVEVILRETRRIVRRGHGVMICETHHGFVCANAGVDLSNAPRPGVAVLLPEDPDASARRLREDLAQAGFGRPGVIISDTFGRPWREGFVDQAIGCAGLSPLADLRGGSDLTGRRLEVTTMATADQLAAAAGLLMVKNAGIPAVWVEGLLPRGEGSVRDLLRDPATDLFR